MITGVVTYQINERKITAFESFAKAWMHPVQKHGGQHHGYLLPLKGKSDQALALFGFKSLPLASRIGPFRHRPVILWRPTAFATKVSV